VGQTDTATKTESSHTECASLILSDQHRGRHAKIFGWAKSAAYDRRYTSDMAYNSQTEILCDVLKDDFAHSSIEIFITIN